MASEILHTHSISIRVNYYEIDGQGRVHNAQYLNFFERGRVEMLRASGISYKDFERTGRMLVVKSMQVEFHSPAEFDEELTLTTQLSHCYGARIDHSYSLTREASSPLAVQWGTRVVTGRSSIACIDMAGKVRRLPPEMQILRSETLGDSTATGEKS